ncbi:MAG: nucleoside deaminase [Bacteroidales bacterium]|nr:nucleoside deaminase [Bacteroidales bacterium]
MSIFDSPDEFYMREALRQARLAFDDDEIPVGAVIVSADSIIARAYNQTERLHDVTAHAEMLAITAAANHLGAKYLTDCTLYVTLEPCPMCAAAAGWAQVSRIVYGAHDPKRGYTQFSPTLLHPRTEVLQGPLAGEAEALLKQFFKNKRG